MKKFQWLSILATLTLVFGALGVSAATKGKMTVKSGKVTYVKDGKTVTAGPGDEIPAGVEIKASERSVLSSGNLEVSLDRNEAVAYSSAGDSVSVEAKSGVIGLKQGGSTAALEAGNEVKVTDAGGEASISVTKGTAQVTLAGKTRIMGKGQTQNVSPGSKITGQDFLISKTDAKSKALKQNLQDYVKYIKEDVVVIVSGPPNTVDQENTEVVSASAP